MVSYSNRTLFIVEYVIVFTMAKKIAKVVQGELRPAKVQLEWIGVDEGEVVIIQDDEGKHGRFLSIYKPEKPEDIELVKKYNNSE